MELPEVQKTMAQLVAAGMSPLQAAGRVGLSPSSARTIARSPLFQALVEKHREELVGPLLERTRKILEGAVPDALETIVGLSKGAKNEAVRFNSAKAVLDWARAVPKEEKQEAGITIVIEGEAAANLHGLAQMIPAIDVTPTAAEVALLIQKREDDDAGISRD